MWVLKTHGESLYVNHVSCEMPWSTKETVDNPHTKGSIKVKHCLLTIDEDNSATLTKLTLIDKIRLRNQRLGISRIMFRDTSFEKVLKDEKIKHSPFKRIYGSCGTSYTVCDLLKPEQVTLLGLKYTQRFRVLMPNEQQYQAYDDKSLWEKMQIQFDREEYGDVDDDDE